MAKLWLRWLAGLFVLDLVFVLPSEPWNLGFGAFTQVPFELSALALIAAAVPRRIWRFVQPVIAFVLVLLIAIKLANIATWEGFGRPFSILADLPLVPTALDTMAKNSVALLIVAVVLMILAFGVVAIVLWWALGRIAGDHHRVPAIVLASIAMLLWFVSGANPDRSFARADTSLLVQDQYAAFQNEFHDTAQFVATMATRASDGAKVPATLRGTDVLLIFVESYGRSAVERDPYAGIIQPALRQGQQTLANAGFHAMSSWATSPTFGGESWLAHSTVLSGLWVTTQARYNALLRDRPPTLASDFRNAGWRTVAVMPEITGPWPEGTRLGFDQTYTAHDLGYAGPPFGYMTMPDQFVLSTFGKRELARTNRPPVMAEIALISSHIPWVPIPRAVPWGDVGDGKIFATARSTEDGDAVWRDPAQIAQFYARSVEYVLQVVTSFIATTGNNHTVVILLGDHQPMDFIAGDAANHDVPIHIIARDPAVLRALASDWTPGMIPAPQNQPLRMDALRGRILGSR